MDVYAVVYGEQCEGYEIQGIYPNIDDAQAKVDEILSTAIWPWIQVGQTRWETGCDQLQIEKYNLETGERVPIT